MRSCSTSFVLTIALCMRAFPPAAVRKRSRRLPYFVFRESESGSMAFTIDVHHHILPDVFWRATNDAHNPVGGISPAPWSRESTLSYMDDAGIDVAITSISTPGVHKGDDAAARSLGLPDSLIDFTADTTRAVAQLHYGNTFARTPNVKYIFSHAGGTIPYLATRFSIVDEMNVIAGAEERGKAADTLRRLYWDTALSWHPANLRMLRSVVGMGQVLFGSDYPYLRRDLAVSCRREVESSAELQANEARAVLAANAFKLFPRFAGHAAPKA
jgi:predicted TIM-barrel fold metal-dependent hydrolase